ncbi:hypothetical protein [Sphingomonas faeni]|uniref:hypothetical protein n=1 Tax=Sphingomonas faeni TaxID=185950 RepID=UPI00335E0649
MNLGWPQGIYLALFFLSVCLHASKNGQPRTGTYDLGTALISAAICISLLWWGGFFS